MLAIGGVMTGVSRIEARRNAVQAELDRSVQVNPT